MYRKYMAAGILTLMFLAAYNIESYADMNIESGAAVSGMAVALNNYYARTISPEQALAESVSLAASNPVTVNSDIVKAETAAPSSDTRAAAEASDNIAIAKVSGNVNIRSEANTSSAIVGKIGNNAAANILETVDGSGGRWYKIKSGNVTGYIKAEYFVTGSAAKQEAKSASTTFGTVKGTATLRLRKEAAASSETLSLLAEGASYEITGEEGDYYKVQVDEDLTGFVFKEYMQTSIKYESAVSNEDEAAKAAEEAKRKKEANDAIAKLESVKKNVELKAPEAETAKAETAAAISSDAPKSSGNTALTVAPGGDLTAGNEKVKSEASKNDAAETKAPETAAETKQAQTKESESKAAETRAAETAASQSKSAAETKAPETAAETKQAQTEANESKAAETKAEETKAAGTALSSGQTYGPGMQGISQGTNEISSATRDAVVAYAKQFIGNPYVYGGTSLTEGADCSGFTMQIFAHFGYSIGRSSRDQAAKGREISIESVRPGDLLFYASGNYINHVALYIGNGDVIHASTAKTGIIITNMYYRTPCKAVSFID